MTTQAALEAHFATFADLPLEAILKQDLLRMGLSFSEDALAVASGFKPKDYFIFSFDLIAIEHMKQNEHLRAPEEIMFQGGLYGMRPTVVSVRVNPDSPYQVTLTSGVLTLTLNQSPLAEVTFHPKPPYHGQKLSDGKWIQEIAPVLEWGYLIYLTAFRMCQYFNREEQCRFCDINRNFVQQRKAGKSYTGIKNVSQILEALTLIDRLDTQRVTQAYTLTGGSIIDTLNGVEEVDFYLQFIEAIESQFPGRWISKAVVQAFERKDCQRLKEVGLTIYHPNFEVWGEDLFAAICPGKQRVIGFWPWMHRIAESAEVFGPEHVIPNFVGGVELNRHCGFDSVEAAVAHTTEGIDWLMSRRIMPRFTTWCPEPLAALGPHEAPPLAYFCLLLRHWRERFHHYDLSLPPGYGEPGPGRAVFSVSAFMDVLPFRVPAGQGAAAAPDLDAEGDSA